MDVLGPVMAFGVMVLLGVGTGVFTGLAPGVHVNNVAVLLLATRGFWVDLVAQFVPEPSPGFVALLLSAYLMAAAASHAVVGFVPSVFLSAPAEDTALAVFPGQRLLHEGRGSQAVSLAARGAVWGALLAALLVVPLRWTLGAPLGLADRFHPMAPGFLLGLLALLVVTEVRGGSRRGRRAAIALAVQGHAALLGIIVLRSSLGLDPQVALFPLFTGLFGMPGLVLGLGSRRRAAVPQEASEKAPHVPREGVHAFRGALAGAAVSWLPGLSGGAAASLASLRVRGRGDPESFLIVLGSVATSTTILSVAVLFMIGRVRSGAAAAIREFLGGSASWTRSDGIPWDLLVLLLAAVGAAVLAAPITCALSRVLARSWSSMDPRRLSGTVLALLVVLLLVFAGPLGLIVAGTAVFVGLIPLLAGVRRIHLMASLLVPVFLSYVEG